MIYLDYNATTPLDPGVLEAMLPFLRENWGNPSSIHCLGTRARAALDECHERVASVLHCKPAEIVFTSGGTESVNLAILGTARRLKNRGRHLVTSTIEHHAVLRACDYLAAEEGFEVIRIPVDSEGCISPDRLSEVIRSDTVLVSIMAANNEIGTIQPVAELGAICRERGVCFHTDAVQWFGKQPFEDIHQFNADLVSLCAHKIHGPKGAGALYIRSPLKLDPILFGGAQQNERRAGTENLAAIAGFTHALEQFVTPPVFKANETTSLADRLAKLLENTNGTHLVGSKAKRLGNTVSFVVEGVDSIAVLAALDLEGICASSGSACSAGSLEPSHVIQALGLPQFANSLIRFSLGRETTAADIDHVEAVLPQLLDRLQLRK